eukprot:m.117857 g.117857  ORF g.117857 m.117857 type:complete len:607 (-) comp15437_c0_seq1:657-2477(-)
MATHRSEGAVPPSTLQLPRASVRSEDVSQARTSTEVNVSTPEEDKAEMAAPSLQQRRNHRRNLSSDLSFELATSPRQEDGILDGGLRSAYSMRDLSKAGQPASPSSRRRSGNGLEARSLLELSKSVDGISRILQDPITTPPAAIAAKVRRPSLKPLQDGVLYMDIDAPDASSHLGHPNLYGDQFSPYEPLPDLPDESRTRRANEVPDAMQIDSRIVLGPVGTTDHRLPEWIEERFRDLSTSPSSTKDSTSPHATAWTLDNPQRNSSTSPKSRMSATWKSKQRSCTDLFHSSPLSAAEPQSPARSRQSRPSSSWASRRSASSHSIFFTASKNQAITVPNSDSSADGKQLHNNHRTSRVFFPDDGALEGNDMKQAPSICVHSDSDSDSDSDSEDNDEIPTSLMSTELPVMSQKNKSSLTRQSNGNNGRHSSSQARLAAIPLRNESTTIVTDGDTQLTRPAKTDKNQNALDDANDSWEEDSSGDTDLDTCDEEQMLAAGDNSESLTSSTTSDAVGHRLTWPAGLSSSKPPARFRQGAGSNERSEDDRRNLATLDLLQSTPEQMMCPRSAGWQPTDKPIPPPPDQKPAFRRRSSQFLLSPAPEPHSPGKN